MSGAVNCQCISCHFSLHHARGSCRPIDLIRGCAFASRLAPILILLVPLFSAQCEHSHSTKFVILFFNGRIGLKWCQKKYRAPPWQWPKLWRWDLRAQVTNRALRDFKMAVLAHVLWFYDSDFNVPWASQCWNFLLLSLHTLSLWILT